MKISFICDWEYISIYIIDAFILFSVNGAYSLSPKISVAIVFMLVSLTRFVENISNIYITK
jgi:hypothetical protein